MKSTNNSEQQSSQSFDLRRRDFLVATAATAGVMTMVANSEFAAAAGNLKRVKQKMVAPPAAPKHEQVASGPPKIVEVRLVTEEKEIVIDGDGTKMWAMTFNGSIPGPMIVVHQDDYVELTLVNPKTSTLEHNIDLHASTGSLGGGGLTHVMPGEEVVFRFKATKAGVFCYHCAPGGAMIPLHVVSGMSGTIMVLPRKGLTDANGKSIKYDKVWHIGEHDYYVPRGKDGKFKTYDNLEDAISDRLDVMSGLIPSHVTIGEKAFAYTGDNSLTAKVGETVLITHMQANNPTQPHLIGGHGDYVWQTGSFQDAPETGLETYWVPGGSAGAMIYTFRQPGLYVYLNHNLIKAIQKGAAAHVKIEGKWDDDLMTQVKKPGPIGG
ncbi:MAG: copper-containing nitrite reductase [Rhodospirillales bacterium]